MIRRLAECPIRLGWLAALIGLVVHRAPAGEWEDAVSYFEGKGGSLNLEDIYPEPVPDEQNFAAIDALRGITIPEGVEHPSGIDGDKVRSRFDDFRKELTDELTAGDLRNYPSLGKGPREGTPIDLTQWAGLDEEGREAFKDSAFRGFLAKRILKRLNKDLGSTFEQVDAAVTRPHSIYVPSFLEFFDREVPALNHFPHSSTVIGFTSIWGLRASAAVYADQPKVASDSILAMLRILEAESQCSPNMVKFLTFNTGFGNTTKPIWEGLRERCFDEKLLSQLQSGFGEVDVMGKLAWSIRGEAVYLSLMGYEDLDVARKFHHEKLIQLKEAMEDASSKIREKLHLEPAEPGHAADGESPPGGDEFVETSELFSKKQWDEARAFILRTYFDALIAPLERRDVSALLESTSELSEQTKGIDINEKRLGTDPMIAMKKSVSTFNRISKDAIISQVRLTFIETSCALERHYLKHRSYPESLEGLVPEFLAKVPADPMDQKPLRYRLTEDGRYQLHSVGFDMSDDGGKVQALLRGQFDNGSQPGGDWIWSYSKLE